MANQWYTASYVTGMRNCSATYICDEASSNGEASFTSYAEYEVSVWLLRIYRPICALFGMTGNAMCILVVMTTSLRHSPTAVYMVTLAALDWVISLYGIVTLLPKDMFVGERSFFTNSWHCKLYYFLKLFVIHFDTLTIVSMTAQRYVAVAFPLQATRLNTRTGAVVSLFVVALVAFLANAVHLFTLEVQPFDGRYRGRCRSETEVGQFLQMRVYPWLDAALYFFFPMLSISVINVLIYRSLQKAECFKQHAAGTNELVSAVSAHTSPPALTPRVQNHEFSPQLRSQVQDDASQDDRFSAGSSTSFREANSSSSESLRASPSDTTTNAPSPAAGTSKQLTSMLLSVSAAFLVLTLPMGVFVVASRYWNPPSGRDKARFALLRDVTDSLMITNHAVNFLLYCLSGRRFRGQAASLLSRLCPVARVARAAAAAGSRRLAGFERPSRLCGAGRGRCSGCGEPAGEGTGDGGSGTVTVAVSSVS